MSGEGVGGFLAELRRRHVVRAGVAYAAFAFVLLQAAEIIQQAWAFSELGLRIVVVFTLLGFPVVLALAWVYEITPQGLRSMAEIDLEAGQRPQASSVPRVALLIVTVLVFGGSGWWWVRSAVGESAVARAAATSAFQAATGREPGGPIRSLAVLPLESFTAEPESGQDYFALGMHEALISQLSQLDFLRVLSRTSAAQFDPSGKSASQIGSELGVDALVEGSVLRAEGRVRITVQLIEASTDRHIWARDYERDFVDIIALQREVAEAIAREIRGELSPFAGEGTFVAESSALRIDPVAAEEVMRGRMALAEGSVGGSPSSAVLDTAALHFQRAILSDSSVASGYAGLAQVFLMRGLADGVTPSPEALRRAAESVRRALELDPTSREIQEIFAQVGLLGGPPAPATLTASPLNVRLGSDSMAVLVAPGGERPLFALTEAGRQIQVAIARREADGGDPSSQVRAARRLVFSGELDEARPLLEQVVAADPGNAEAWDELEQILRFQGDANGLVALWRARVQAEPNRGSRAPSIQDLSRSVQRSGMEGYWRWRLADLEARERGGLPVSPVDVARAHAALGNADRALTLLEQGAEAGDPRLRSIRSDPVWDFLRRDPRYIAVLSETPSGSGFGGGRGEPQGQGREGAGGRSGGGGQGGESGRSGGSRGPSTAPVPPPPG